MNNRETILIAHPLIRFAGSEARAAYCLQEFQEDYDLVLVTGGPVDIDKLNQVYGTSIDPERVRQLYPWYHFLLEWMRMGDALRGTLFGRFLRKVAGAYPLCVSVYNFMDFGKPAVHFCWDEEIRLRHDATPPPGVRGFFHRYSLVRRSYLGCGLIGGGRRGSVPPQSPGSCDREFALDGRDSKGKVWHRPSSCLSRGAGRISGGGLGAEGGGFCVYWTYIS